MLNRAASNAYSWWWASHIRTKQSKWLDSNLQEMEERVKSMLKLLGEEADSFGKRAEMYYKKRPEVISSVEEAYRAYRALAERYDHISGELHKANHTIATAFPDQVHYAMLEEEDDNFPKAITPVDSSKIQKQTVQSLMNKKQNFKLPILKETKNVNKENAQEEIKKLQKDILVIQTEKEFIKSSYECGIAKFWELEKKMADMQEEVIFLQEEFNTSAVFEDDEARALMTATALKSCEDTVFSLREKQRKSLESGKVELERVKVSKQRLRDIKGEKESDLSDDLDLKVHLEEGYEIKMERMEMDTICEKIKNRFEMDSGVSIEETAEKIDQLVNKVVDLELFVSSQTAQINRLNLENSQLEKNLEDLESKKADLINDSSELSEKLKKAEEELSIVQSIQKAIIKEENNVRLNFSQVVNSLSDISENLQSPFVKEEIAPVKTSEFEANGNNIDLDQILVNNLSDISDHLQSPFIKEEIAHVNTSEIGAANENKIDFEQILGNNLTDISENSQLPIIKEEISQFKSESCDHCSNGNIDFGQILLNEVSNINGSEDNINGSVYFEANEDLSVSNGQNFIENGFHLQNESTWENFDSKSESIFGFDHLQNGNHSISHSSNEHIELNKDEHRNIIEENITENLLLEHTSVLQECKETKKRLTEIEARNQEHILELSSQIRELMNINAMKDAEILSLKQLLDCSKTSSNSNNPSQDSASSSNENNKLRHSHQRSHIRSFSILKGFNLDPPKEPDALDGAESSTSSLEEKFRTDLDALLEENLEFWLRFSRSIQTIQNFQNKHQQMQKDENALKAKDLRDLKTEIQVWLEQNALLRSELKSRLSSIQTVQEEINQAVGPTFSSYQAAKFQGEVLNMQQENNRVANELKAGLDHVRGIQDELETALERIQERISISESRSSGASSNDKFRSIPTKNRVPLRSFLFPAKPKKPSLFACVNPVLHRQYSGLKSTFYTRLD